MQASEIIAGIVVDAQLDLEATAALCEDLSPLPSFAFGRDRESSDILSELSVARCSLMNESLFAFVVTVVQGDNRVTTYFSSTDGNEA